MSKRRVASTLPRPQHSKTARRISCRHWKDIPTATIAAATTVADETAMIYMRGSKGSCQSGQPRTAAASRARREREGTSIPVSTSHLDRRHDRWAWRSSLAQLPVGSLCQTGTRPPSPGHISEAWAPAGDKQYIYDARPPGLFVRHGKESHKRKEAPQPCERTSGAKTTSEPGTTGDRTRRRPQPCERTSGANTNTAPRKRRGRHPRRPQRAAGR